MKITFEEMHGILKGRAIPGDIKVNESIAAYLVRKFDTLYAQLEAVQRERAEDAAGLIRQIRIRDEELKRRDDVDASATRGMPDYEIFVDGQFRVTDMVELSVLQRQQEITRQLAVESNRLSDEKRALTEELKRRDEQKPDGHIFCHPSGRLFWAVTDDSNAGRNGVRPYYFAVPAAVLPPECVDVPDELKNDLSEAEKNAWISGENAMRQRTKALGCQPKNDWVSCVEMLPALGRYLVKHDNPLGNEIVIAKYVEYDFCAGVGNVQRFWLDDRSRSISPMRNVTHWMPLPSLDAAGVKWEIK